MANIDNGALEFDAVMNNGQMDKAIKETQKKIQGFVNTTMNAGKVIDQTFDITTENIRIQKQIIADLEGDVERLNDRIKHMAPGKAQHDLMVEVAGVTRELNAEKDALVMMEGQMDKTEEKTLNYRTQIRKMRDELVSMEAAGLRGTEHYEEVRTKMANLVDAVGDAMRQANILAHDQAALQGVISGLSGVAGTASAAQGAMSLLVGENENLQRIMLKVQSLMSITIGLQQVEQTLNKDSAFMVKTMGDLKAWWTKITATATVAETAEMAATSAHTAANWTLAASFRAVGAAIKSIPVTGWLLAGVAAIVGMVVHFTNKTRQAKKAQDEFNTSLAEGCYKNVASIETLSAKWNALGNNMDAKTRFVEANQKAFDDLGASINSVADAERLLNGQKDEFIEAQISKAKAAVYFDQANEKVKELMKLEAEYNAMSDTSMTFIQTDGFGGGKYVEGINKAKIDKKADIDALRKEIEAGYKEATIAETESIRKMTELGLTATDEYAEGTIGAIEKAIHDKTTAMKKLSDHAAIQKTMREIDDLQTKLDSMTGKTNAGGSDKEKDQFKKSLDAKKSLYSNYRKWMESQDPVVRSAAKQEFAGLLEEGKSYIEYLKNQRDDLMSIVDRTAEEERNLSTLNSAIAEETTRSIVDSFETALNDQLSKADSVLEKLEIIKNAREELSGDGSDIDTEKGEVLDKVETTTNAERQKQIDDLLAKYASFVDQKRQLEADFNADMALLDAQRIQATSDADRQRIDAAKANRTTQFNEDVKNVGGYGDMLAEYGSFEEKKQAIFDKYEAQRKKAREMGNESMIAGINEAEAQSLSSLAVDALQMSPDWELMFGDLDEVSTRKLGELVEKIESLQGAYLGIEFSPQDLDTIKNKVGEMKEEIQERNPFKALGKAVKEYSKTTDKEAKKGALTRMMNAAADASNMVGGSISAISDGLVAMGMDADSEAAAVMGDLAGIADGAGQLAEGIATMNPVSMIQGSVGMISSVIDLFNFHDRAAERRIKRHQAAVDDLKNSYNQLSWAVDKALGNEVYKNQKAEIRNMEEQQRHLRQMIAAEDSKKKTDHDRIREWEENIADLDRQIADIFDEISNDILQTDAKTFADQLGDALVEAFSKGEDASESFAKTVDDVMKNAVLNQLKKRFLEEQLQGALDQLEAQMGWWNGDDFIFDGLTQEEQDRFKDKIKGISDTFTQALGVYSDLFNVEDPDDTALSGSIKGVTEETANVLAGYMNAIRIGQAESNAAVRQQLIYLSEISYNTSFCRYLQRLENIFTLLNTRQSGSLRGQGLS